MIFIILFSGCVENQEKNKEENSFNEKQEPVYNQRIITVGNSADSNFTHIQDALDNASNNDIILVQPGIYLETILINKSIQLIGEDRDNTIILSEYDTKLNMINILTINVDNCSIKNLSFVKSHGDNIRGVIINSNNNTIMNCNISGLYFGIEINRYSMNNLIKQNIISKNTDGIWATYTENNVIIDNYIYGNLQHGLYFFSYSNSNLFSKNIFINNEKALRIKASKSNLIIKNYFYNNNYGIYLCCGATDNNVFNNTLIKNIKDNAYESYKLENHWNADNGSFGNYWDDYTGVDENKNGIGDTYYVIPNSGGFDHYPLMNPSNVDYYFKNKIINL